MKNIAKIIAVITALVLVFSLAACGEKNEDKKEETKAATTAATEAATAPATTAPATTAPEATLAPATTDDGQEGTAPEGQEEYMNQQKAIQDVIGRATELYGDGDWRVESFNESVEYSGGQCYYIGVKNYASEDDLIHYFYCDGAHFCIEDEEAISPPEGQQYYMDQQKAIGDAIERAVALYGAGDWRQESIEESVEPGGAECFLVGVANYDDDPSTVYYFYTDGQHFCYPAD